MNYNIKEVVGKTFDRIEVNDFSDKLELFHDHEKVSFFHSSICCESVYIENIIGDLNDLINSPILELEVSEKKGESGAIWTFHKFITQKGTVVIEWYGGKNYYPTTISYVVWSWNSEVNQWYFNQGKKGKEIKIYEYD